MKKGKMITEPSPGHMSKGKLNRHINIIQKNDYI